jgi:uroporphyrinogen decarboxylase
MTSTSLPFGTPQQVRDETRRRIEDLAPGGGYVFAPIHVIQAGVPPENIIAWWETLMEYGLPQLADERLHIAVLPEAPGLDEQRRHVQPVQPVADRFGREFRPIIRPNVFRHSSP